MINNFLWFLCGFGVGWALLCLILYYAFSSVSQDDQFYMVDYFDFLPGNKKYKVRVRVKNLKFKKNYIKFITEDNIHVRVNYLYFISSVKEQV